jgi:cyclomaltodextrinase
LKTLLNSWGIGGRKSDGSDQALRPSLDIEQVARESSHAGLARAIARLAMVRGPSRAPRRGDYRLLFVGPKQLAFERRCDGETAIVAVNAASQPAALDFPAPTGAGSSFTDMLNEKARYQPADGRLRLELPACWARVLVHHSGKSG